MQKGRRGRRMQTWLSPRPSTTQDGLTCITSISPCHRHINTLSPRCRVRVLVPSATSSSSCQQWRSTVSPSLSKLLRRSLGVSSNTQGVNGTQTAFPDLILIRVRTHHPSIRRPLTLQNNEDSIRTTLHPPTPPASTCSMPGPTPATSSPTLQPRPVSAVSTRPSRRFLGLGKTAVAPFLLPFRASASHYPHSLSALLLYQLFLVA